MKIWIGDDQVREPGAADVCEASIRRFYPEASIERLTAHHEKVRQSYTRTWRYNLKGDRIDNGDGKPFSTDFAFSRFLVPHMMGYEGWALFCDGDIMFRSDILKLLLMAHPRYAVMCVKHEHHPEMIGEPVLKLNGIAQTIYPRKNWSSLILWNCAHPKNIELTSFVVNHADGAWLHAFTWLEDDDIGSIPESWNWLVGVSPTTATEMPPFINGVHYTRGIPGQLCASPSSFDEEWLALAEQRDARDCSMKEEEKSNG